MGISLHQGWWATLTPQPVKWEISNTICCLVAKFLVMEMQGTYEFSLCNNLKLSVHSYVQKYAIVQHPTTSYSQVFVSVLMKHLSIVPTYLYLLSLEATKHNLNV